MVDGRAYSNQFLRRETRAIRIVHVDKAIERASRLFEIATTFRQQREVEPRNQAVRGCLGSSLESDLSLRPSPARHEGLTQPVVRCDLHRRRETGFDRIIVPPDRHQRSYETADGLAIGRLTPDDLLVLPYGVSVLASLVRESSARSILSGGVAHHACDETKE